MKVSQKSVIVCTFSLLNTFLKHLICARLCSTSISSMRKIKGCESDVKESVIYIHSNSVAQSCPTICGPMNHSTAGLPAHHQLLESGVWQARKILQMCVNSEQDKCIFLSRLERVLVVNLPPSS